jgi:hypothetical protein
MLPELDSMITVPAVISPESRACRMMLKAGRSFVLPPGFSDSNLANTLNSSVAHDLDRRTRGVLPIADKILVDFMTISLP